MGQKTNPNIFRLGVNKKWKTEFFEKKNQELPIYTFKDLEIKSCIERFLESKDLLLHDYKLHYSDSVLNVYISYFVTASFAFDRDLPFNSISVIKKSNNVSKIVVQTNSKSSLKRRQATGKLNDSVSAKKFLSNKIKNYLKIKHYNSTVASGNSIVTKASLTRFLAKKDFCSFNPSKAAATRSWTLENLNATRFHSDFQKLLKSLSLFTGNRYTIVATFSCANKSFNLTPHQTQTLKEKFMLLQKYRNAPFFEKSVNLLFTSVYLSKSANILARFIAFQLKTIKRQKFFLAFLKRTLAAFVNANFSNVEGIKVLIKGRINGVPRARQKILSVGRVPVQTISANVDYAQSACHNANGSYGLKVWISEKL